MSEGELVLTPLKRSTPAPNATRTHRGTPPSPQPGPSGGWAWRVHARYSLRTPKGPRAPARRVARCLRVGRSVHGLPRRRMHRSSARHAAGAQSLRLHSTGTAQEQAGVAACDAHAELQAHEPEQRLRPGEPARSKMDMTVTNGSRQRTAQSLPALDETVRAPRCRRHYEDDCT